VKNIGRKRRPELVKGEEGRPRFWKWAGANFAERRYRRGAHAALKKRTWA